MELSEKNHKGMPGDPKNTMLKLKLSEIHTGLKGVLKTVRQVRCVHTDKCV